MNMNLTISLNFMLYVVFIRHSFASYLRPNSVPSDESLPSSLSSSFETATMNEVNHYERNHDNDRDLIIGGQDTVEGRHFYMAAIVNSTGHHQCGGTLIAKDTVLTAAHCKAVIDYGGYVQLGRYEYDDEDVNIRNRSNKGGDAGIETFQVRKQVLHSGFHEYLQKRLLRYDFLLLFLNGSSSYQPIIVNHDETIPLPSSTKNNDREEDTRTSLYVMGWGRTNLTLSQGSNILQEAEVKYVPNKQCEESSGSVGTYAGLIFEDHICAIDYGEDACYGDSGGPLIIKNSETNTAKDSQRDVLVGIVSWGFLCGHNSFPGVYGRVSNIYGWIRDNVCTLSRDSQGYFDCDGEEDLSPPSCQPSRQPSRRPSRQPSAVPSPRPFCSSDQECLPAGVCTKQDHVAICKKLDSQACFFDNECLSDKCRKGLCHSNNDSGLGIGRDCTRDDQCLSKQCSDKDWVCVEDKATKNNTHIKKRKKNKKKKGV